MERNRERVALVPCKPEESEERIVAATEEAVARLGDAFKGAADRLANARTVAVKINAGIHRADVLTDGRQTELTEPAVVEGVIRVLRAATDAEIVIGDATTDGDAFGLYEQLGLPDRLARYGGIRFVDFNRSETVEVTMPHAGESVASGRAPMFRRYRMPREIVEADAFVSVAKMKAHQSLGYTLCIKNLFGWMPTSVYGAPRHYLHDRLVRLPRVLSDMARWLQPCLNVVDGIVAANKSEWRGEALRPGVILAGTNVVATDSVGARVMGFDPQTDYPHHPHLYRRNAIKLAADAGLGPNAASDIEVLGPAPESVVTPFTVHEYVEGQSDAERIAGRNEELRRGVACAAAYRDQRDVLLQRYGSGRYLALRDGKVIMDAPDMATLHRQLQESGVRWQDFPQLFVQCVPCEDDPEVWDWYEAEAEQLPKP